MYTKMSRVRRHWAAFLTKPRVVVSGDIAARALSIPHEPVVHQRARQSSHIPVVDVPFVLALHVIWLIISGSP